MVAWWPHPHYHHPKEKTNEKQAEVEQNNSEGNLENEKCRPAEQVGLYRVIAREARDAMACLWVWDGKEWGL